MDNSNELHTVHQPAKLARRGLHHFKISQSQIQANLINQGKGNPFQRAVEGKKRRGNRVKRTHLPIEGLTVSLSHNLQG